MINKEISNSVVNIEVNVLKATYQEIFSQDEITVMYGSKCIFQLRGVKPFLSDKFDITRHKNYKLLEDYDKKNVFDIEEYIKRKGKAKMNGNTVIARL